MQATFQILSLTAGSMTDHDELSTSLGGGGGYSQKNWVGGGGPLPKTLTLFMTYLVVFLAQLKIIN